MARLVGIQLMPHTPFRYPMVSAPRDRWSPQVVEMVERDDIMREHLARLRPDVLIMVGHDHFHQFFMDNMPAFCVGVMDRFDGTFLNETREFGIPPCTVPGDAALAEELIEGCYARSIDVSVSRELKIDHALVIPLQTVRPEMDLPIVPILTNCEAPPLPPAERFVHLGHIIREIVDALPSEKRAVLIASGHLSLDVGGPMQLGRLPVDAEFDREAIGWIQAADAQSAIKACTFERMHMAGTVGPGILNYLVALGAARGARPGYFQLVGGLRNARPNAVWSFA